MKFKKGKLYKVVRRHIADCKGCILRYEGDTEVGTHYGKPTKLGKRCEPSSWQNCCVFQDSISDSNICKMERKWSMVDFCKKLRKELKNDSS